jgi:hypothetical protein
VTHIVFDTWEATRRTFESELARQTWQGALAIDARTTGWTKAPRIRWLVRHPVTVVVAAVADLGDRWDLVDADFDATDASDHARDALAFVGSARADVRQCFVDSSVAIIVEEIADLRGRSDAARAHDGSGLGIAHVDARNALPDIASACGAHWNLVVDHAIAIVVESIAELRHRAHGSFAHERSHIAASGARRALTGIVAARHTRFWIALIRSRVAIVISSVAQLVARTARPNAAERPRNTLHDSRPALTDRARSAGCTSSWISFVHSTIAIVVERVACFDTRAHAARAHEHASHALECAQAAYACVATTRTTAAQIAFVRSRVAVVIDAIADLVDRYDPSKARSPCATATGAPTWSTSSDSASAIFDLTVGDAVTVVIRSVARLDARWRFAYARTPVSRRAYLRARNANTETASACPREPLVDGSVAIVIEIVANLGSRVGAAAGAFIDDAITIVVGSVAGLRWRGTAGAAQISQSLVDTAVTIVVHAIADTLTRIGAECLRGDSTRTIAIARESFIGAHIAVVVGAITDLVSDRICDDLREREREARFIARVKSTMHAWCIRTASECDVFDIGIASRNAESDDVCADIVGESSDGRGSERGGGVDCTAAARLVTVSQQNDGDGSTRAIRISSQWTRGTRVVVSRCKQSSAKGRIASSSKLGIVADVRARAGSARIVDPTQDVALVVRRNRNQDFS